MPAPGSTISARMKPAAAESGSPASRGSCRRDFRKIPCRWWRPISTSSGPSIRLTACEVEPNARKSLIDALRRDTQARVVDLDGWTALPAFVPPNERRGLVLIDPPFEAKDEFERMETGFAEAFAKWPTGIYLLWYP